MSSNNLTAITKHQSNTHNEINNEETDEVRIRMKKRRRQISHTTVCITDFGT